MMAEKEIDLRRLVIKAFHMTDVEWGEHNNITTDGHMTVSKEMIDQLVAQDDCIEKIDIQIIKPGDHDRWTNTIMDIIPISTKVLGKLGEGITHTITGVYVMPLPRIYWVFRRRKILFFAHFWPFDDNLTTIALKNLGTKEWLCTNLM